MLEKCFLKNLKVIKSFKYDLDDKEVMTIAEISRDACSYYENGIFLLLVYFIKASEYFQKKGSTAEVIEEKISKAISQISFAYPPGKGLS